MRFSSKIILLAGGVLAVGWLFFSSGPATAITSRESHAVGRANVAAPAAREAPGPAAAPSPAAALNDEIVRQRICGRASLNPRAAADEAAQLADPALRKTVLEDIMALWLHKDRLDAAEWLLGQRKLPEFDPLSAQVSAAFFPDDTEMSAMFAFDIRDEKLRDPLVNKLVAYWRSGAHLKSDDTASAGPESESGGDAAPQASPVVGKL